MAIPVKPETTDDFVDLLRSDPIAEVAYIESRLLRWLSTRLDRARVEKKMTLKGIATKAQVPSAEVRRLFRFNGERGGRISITTLLRVLEVLNLPITISLQDEEPHGVRWLN